jgi:hypothetical protein
MSVTLSAVDAIGSTSVGSILAGGEGGSSVFLIRPAVWVEKVE